MRMATDTPLTDVDFLTRSQNRVELLRATAARTHDRDELESLLGISRVTLSRLLSDLEERGWITREDNGYRTTAVGDAVNADLETLIETVATGRKLQEVFRWIPIDELGLDLRAFADADLIRPDRIKIGSVIHHHVERIKATKRFDGLIDAIEPIGAQAYYEGTTQDRMKSRIVLTTTAYDELNADERMSGWMSDVLESGSKVIKYEGEIPISVLILDDMAMFFLVDQDGVHGLLESENEAVLEWAREYIDEHSQAGNALERGAFTPNE